MSLFSNKYGDFSDLEALADIFDDAGVIIAEGRHRADGPHPGPHVTISSPNASHGYNFVKNDDGTYTVTTHRMDKKD